MKSCLNLKFALRAVALTLLFLSQKIIAEEMGLLRGNLDPLEEEYLFVEIARNFPQSFSLRNFKAGGYHPIIGYRYNLMGHWMMGLGVQFKNFERKKPKTTNSDQKPEDQSRNFAIWTVYHEGLYLIRLDHPTYLLIGPKILYLLPSKAAALPLERDDAYSVEIGGSISGSLVRILSNKSYVSLRMDRWRGTKTNKIHGIEISLGYGLPF